MAKPKGNKTAAKPKTKVQADGAGARPEAAEFVPLIKPKVLKDLLKSDSGFRSDIDEITGQLREAIAFAVEKQHLNKDAFALLKKFNRMEPEKLARLWPELIAYMKITGMMDVILSAPELPLGPGKEDGEGEGESRSGFGGPAARVKEMAENAGAKTGAAE